MSNLVLTVEERKNKLVDRLSTQYSHNNISLDEYERLIKYSQNIETDRELLILEKLIEGHETAEVKKEEKIFSEPQNSRNSQINSSSQDHFTILSSRKTTGAITSGNIMNVLGEHKIIITESDLINDNTTLNVMVLLGSVIIHVPENVDVNVKVMPLLADISVPDKVRNKNARKSLTINGSCILGNVNIKIKN